VISKQLHTASLPLIYPQRLSLSILHAFKQIILIIFEGCSYLAAYPQNFHPQLMLALWYMMGHFSEKQLKYEILMHEYYIACVLLHGA